MGSGTSRGLEGLDEGLRGALLSLPLSMDPRGMPSPYIWDIKVATEGWDSVTRIDIAKCTTPQHYWYGLGGGLGCIGGLEGWIQPVTYSQRDEWCEYKWCNMYRHTYMHNTYTHYLTTRDTTDTSIAIGIPSPLQVVEVLSPLHPAVGFIVLM